MNLVKVDHCCMFVVIKRKYTRGGLIAFLCCIFIYIFLGSHVSSHERRNVGGIDSISASLKMAGSEVEKSRKFNTLANRLLKRKLKEDVDGLFYALDTTITRAHTELHIPLYFKPKQNKKFEKGPFDPRLTLAAYYNYFLHDHRPIHEIKVPFHWSDWVDMSALDTFFFKKPIWGNTTCSYFDERPYQSTTFEQNEKTPDPHKGALDPREFCRGMEGNTTILGLNFNIFRPIGRMTQQKARMAAKAYLYTLAPNPESILFLTKDGSYHVPVSREKEPLIAGNKVSEALELYSKKHDTINTLGIFRKLQKERPAAKEYVVTDYEIPLKHEDFVVEPSKVLLALHTKENERPLTRHEDIFRKAILTSLFFGNESLKYFTEAKVFDTTVGDHYDWRFFNGIEYQSEENALSLHRLIRTWLSFTRKLGLKTWVAHGSLLAWHFNGMNFPWDDDVDVQMPIQDLLKLSEHFNQSMIVEDTEDGFGRFFLDCSTPITSREHGNGMNNIDARFIDVDSGLYIDITGLAVSNEKLSSRYHDSVPQVIMNLRVDFKDVSNTMRFYNCKNRHFVSLSEISPLVRTFFDGEVAYVPKNYATIISHEYKDGLTRRQHLGRIYLGQLRIWVHQSILMSFLRNPSEWDAHFANKKSQTRSALPPVRGEITAAEFERLQNLSENELFRLLHHDEIFLRYQLSKEVTMFHEAEGMRFLLAKSTEALILEAPDSPPLRYDPFLFALRQQFMSFEDNVDRYQKLAAESEERDQLFSKKLKLAKILSKTTTAPVQSSTHTIGTNSPDLTSSFTSSTASSFVLEVNSTNNSGPKQENQPDEKNKKEDYQEAPVEKDEDKKEDSKT